MNDFFQSCEICGHSNWEERYRGEVRDGAFVNLSKEECVVAKCLQCGVERLNESACKSEDFYESDRYRRLLHEPEDVAGFMKEHDVTQLRNLSVLWPESIRNKNIADIGCAAGSFLDHVSGLAREKVAIEPSEDYHHSLKDRGYHVYPYAKDAAADWKEKIDFAFCFSVIEHVQNPRAFLNEIRELLNPDGKLILSTPNRLDIMMDLKGDEYKRFFYRSVHRWYFDAASFIYCAREAGLKVIEKHCVHRFGLSNAMAWLRDGKPTGDIPLPHLDSPLLDNFWKRYVESKGVGDYLYFKIKRES
jgi:SAM-dependent methyltransferase